MGGENPAGAGRQFFETGALRASKKKRGAFVLPLKGKKKRRTLYYYGPTKK